MIRTAAVVLMLMLAQAAWAQSLTNAQRTTLKADILGRANLATAVATADDQAIADWYNSAAQTGEYTAPLTCWKPAYPVASLNGAIDWAAYAGLTQVRQNAYMAMTQAGQIDLTDNQVRAGVTAVFGAGSATETTIFSATDLADSQQERGARAGTRFEVLLGNVRGPHRRCIYFGQQLTPQTVSTVLRN